MIRKFLHIIRAIPTRATNELWWTGSEWSQYKHLARPYLSKSGALTAIAVLGFEGCETVRVIKLVPRTDRLGREIRYGKYVKDDV